MIDESTFLGLIEKMNWSELDAYEIVAKENGLINDALLPGLESERKQVIELLIRLFVEKSMESAIPCLFEVIKLQPNSANAIRARNALIRFGMKAMPESHKYINDPKWIVRFHTVQIIAMTKHCDVLEILIRC